MRAELRYYRDAYDAGTTYASGDEVYLLRPRPLLRHRRHYTANAPPIPTTGRKSPIWMPISRSTRRARPRSAPCAVFTKDDPETTDRPWRVLFSHGAERHPCGRHRAGERLRGSATARPCSPGTDYSAAATYTVGRVAYYSSSTTPTTMATGGVPLRHQRRRKTRDRRR